MAGDKKLASRPTSNITLTENMMSPPLPTTHIYSHLTAQSIIYLTAGYIYTSHLSTDHAQHMDSCFGATASSRKSTITFPNAVLKSGMDIMPHCVSTFTPQMLSLTHITQLVSHISTRLSPSLSQHCKVSPLLYIYIL